MVHFSSILSGHLAFVARNDPLVPAGASGDSTSTSNAPETPILVQFEQAPAKAGLLVTDELRAGIERVKKNVAAISKACRARNSRFRDVEFDLEEDREKCLHGLDTRKDERSDPSDVQRVTQAFREPKFFVDGPSSTDVVQGALGDCWFLSGAAAVATMPELVENFCVANDPEVGVYGFMFQRNGIWTDVIIDDLLYTAMPKYEELSSKEQQLYHEDKDRYNGTARLGSKSLYFAKSGSSDETWVPLLEKAYAKLHGDYAALTSGHVGEAMEDLTGGVSTVIHVNDILNIDQFWKDELLRANQDRLFGCSIYDLRSGSGTYPTDPGYGPPQKTVNGLYTAHAYSIIKAVEYNGKRFLRIRNPWGNSEWTGRWSDGSKEWTSEWVAALDQLGHTFGDDGAFVMEYQDFLDTWTLVHRTKLFDPSWVVSSLWMNAKIRLPGMVWDYGDISFTFSLPARSPVIIVLSKLDDRYARGLLDRMRFSLDFQVFKKGGAEPIIASRHSVFHLRSVNAEATLDTGDYVVHVRVDSEIIRGADYLSQNIPKWNTRKIAQVLSLVAETSSILANFPVNAHDSWLRRPAQMWAGRDLQEIQNAVNRATAAATSPLSYPPPPHHHRESPTLRGATSPLPPSALGALGTPTPTRSHSEPVPMSTPSEPGDDSDFDSEDYEDDDDDDDDNVSRSTIYDIPDIPGFPLGPAPTGHLSAGHGGDGGKNSVVSPTVIGSRGGGGAPGSRSPLIMPGGFDFRAAFDIDIDTAGGDHSYGDRVRTRSGKTRQLGRQRRTRTVTNASQHHGNPSARTSAEPTPFSIMRPPVRSMTGYSETSNVSGVSGVSTSLLAGSSQAATARIMTNPEVQVSDDPELAIGLRVYTKNFGNGATVEINGQIRQGKLYPWRGV